jgi:ornithine cyclodeaminase/alanine dehydrogenase-like protein (mu-crystallin family)
VCVFPGNHQLGIDSHQGSVLLHDGRTGELRAILNGSLVTSIRTAAVTAVATAALARPDSRVLAIVGTGIQAGRHLESLTAAFAFDEIRVVGRSPDSARRFATRWADLADVRPGDSVRSAVEGADVVVTVTSSAEPVVERAWIAAGTHISAVGSSVKSKRELDSATVAAASLFVDRRESALNESGDFLIAAAECGLGPDHIKAEIGEVLAGSASGRTGDGEITLFKSLGLAVEDLVAAELAVAIARERGLGTTVEF